MTVSENPFQEKFDELSAMRYEEQSAALTKEPLENLDALLCVKNSPRLLVAEDAQNTYEAIMLERYVRIRDAFEWTPENIKRVLALSALFSAAWEKGFAEAKNIIDTLYEHAENKTEFLEDYRLEIVLEPLILVEDPETGEPDIPVGTVEEALMNHLRPDIWLTITVNKRVYNPATKDESGFREDIHIKRDLNWNIESAFAGFEDDFGYICYAIHTLLDGNWTMRDILQITDINIEVRFIWTDVKGF